MWINGMDKEAKYLFSIGNTIVLSEKTWEHMNNLWKVGANIVLLFITDLHSKFYRGCQHITNWISPKSLGVYLKIY